MSKQYEIQNTERLLRASHVYVSTWIKSGVGALNNPEAFEAEMQYQALLEARLAKLKAEPKRRPMSVQVALLILAMLGIAGFMTPVIAYFVLALVQK